ncbi:cbb3-type cytochrome oxidase subunit 3 [Roseovarius sp. D0-M9]|uniref:cbb3-type cytochrome oxidase subunit 3 n=1 Tax=Roseovarius sp. D0-M9 TaxID=3127117 RepID=UPI0030100811
MSYDVLVYLAKTIGLFWMMGFFIIVVIIAYNPKRRAAHDYAAQSILRPDDREGGA